MQSGVKILKAQLRESERGGYLCARRRHLECFLHDSLNDEFKARLIF